MSFTKTGILIISLLLIKSNYLYPQQRGYFHVDAGLSQTYKGFFYLFNGIADAGAGYNYYLTKGLFAGPSLHFDFLNRKNTSGRTVVYKPKLNLLYEIQISKKFAIEPVASIGFAFLNVPNNEFGYNETQQGLNLSGDLRLIWKTHERLDFYFLAGMIIFFLIKMKHLPVWTISGMFT